MEEHTNDPEVNQNEELTGETSEKENASTEAAPAATKEEPKEEPKITVAELDIDALVTTLEQLTSGEAWKKQRDTIEAINTRFRTLFTADFEQRKKAFLQEEGANEIDFEYRPEFKLRFDSAMRDYRKKKQQFYQQRASEQKINQERKEAIIEEIKALAGKDDNINTIYKSFKSLQESWYSTGPAPRAVNNTLWQNFKHHVERFYDFLHLNRELRELDFQHNYEEKLKIIEKAEALTTHPDILRATRDLNTLHRIWKNDLGPVAKEHREDLWKRFQEATKKIHDRRQEYQKNYESIQKENLTKKEELLQQIEALIAPVPTDHRTWQTTIKNFEKLKADFQAIGYVPKKRSKEIWSKYREICRAVNHAKNEFYKKQKNQQRENSTKAKALLEEIQQVLDADDWNTKVQQVKALQKQWTKLGHLPKKMLPLRKEFQKLCNTYFDRLRSGYQRLSDAEQKVVEQRDAFLANYKKETPEATAAGFATFFDTQWSAWLALGEINAAAAKTSDEAFYQASCALLKKVKLDKELQQQLRQEYFVRCMEQHPEAIRQKQAEYKKQYDAVQAEAQQLENNLEFFSNSSSDSPMVKDLSKKLELLQVKMEQTKSEGNALRSLVRKAKSATKVSAAPTEEDTTPEGTPTQNDTPEETAPAED